MHVIATIAVATGVQTGALRPLLQSLEVAVFGGFAGGYTALRYRMLRPAARLMFVTEGERMLIGVRLRPVGRLRRMLFGVPGPLVDFEMQARIDRIDAAADRSYFVPLRLVDVLAASNGDMAMTITRSQPAISVVLETGADRAALAGADASERLEPGAYRCSLLCTWAEGEARVARDFSITDRGARWAAGGTVDP